jgi:hypothetical protein
VNLHESDFDSLLLSISIEFSLFLLRLTWRDAAVEFRLLHFIFFEFIDSLII